ncbi:MAG: nucleotide exchange factor GrpE [Alphaproteobacteria bacterium]|nr:nucleotide exchange factor GrpE [Alphaproteobacteria bacterium]
MTHHHKHTEEIKELDQEMPEEEAPAAEEKSDQEDKIAQLQAEADKFKDLYLRAQAEMENLRRRTQQELEKRSKFAVSAFAQDLLPVNDNLSRAMASIPETEKEEQSDLIKNLLIGLELTQKDLNSALEKNNITPIESVGHVFDPNLHKVVQEIDDPTKPTGTIIQEWQKGYMIGGDRVLREAVVIVTKGGPLPRQKTEETHIDTTV